MEKDLNNRYTRLVSIKEFGYDINWNKIHNSSVTIAGVGGLGYTAAEMLVRLGVGRIFIFDKDIVESVNLNRMGYDNTDLNEPKVRVVKRKLELINPDVSVESFHGDIMLLDGEINFENAIKKSNVVIMGLDNYPARVYVNKKCVDNNIVLMDGGASRSALSGHIHPIFPGKNACMQCTSFKKGLERSKGEVCTASLPTTMSIIASIQVQETLKYLLGNLGENIDYMTYNALTGQFTHHKTKRDPECIICGHLK